MHFVLPTWASLSPLYRRVLGAEDGCYLTFYSFLFFFFCKNIHQFCQEFSRLCPGYLADWEQTLLPLIDAPVYRFPFLVTLDTALLFCVISSSSKCLSIHPQTVFENTDLFYACSRLRCAIRRARSPNADSPGGLLKLCIYFI